MENLWTHDSLLALKNLLKDPDSEDSDHEPNNNSAISKMKPSDINAKTKKQEKSKNTSSQQKPKNPDEIWDVDEIPDGAQYEDLYDPRTQPKYEIFYKQSVTAEDIYLQLGMKNPTTASCEYMVIKIYLPNSKLAEINLDVKEKYLDLRAPEYKLGLHLPNPVEPDSSKALWNEEKYTLEVTLRNKREFEFMNE